MIRNFYRRRFIKTLAFMTPAIVLRPPSAWADGARSTPENISPAEDLMREHGALNRILLIYKEAMRRLFANEIFDPELLKDSAGLIKKFIENYHEKLEEEYLFPRFRQAHKLVDLVDILEAQHKAGRHLTSRIESLSDMKSFKNESARTKLQDAMKLFIRMYRPHEAREDTILFPAFRKLLSPKEYDALGDKFEDKEHELFGKEGFEGVVAQIAEIEKKLGIYDLSQYTPPKEST